MLNSRFMLVALACAMFSSAHATNATCDPASLNTTSFNYVNDIENQTVHEMAVKFNRGVCDIGRANLMVDVSVVPNVGQTIIIPAEVCDPDWTTCIIDGPGTNDCLIGGPRLYYTLNGDTLWKIAGRLNMTLDAVQCGGDGCNTNVTCTDGICPGGSGGQYSANETISAGQFIKIPMCYPSICEIEPYSFTAGVYKDLADKYGSTVGQIQMLSPTYNYSYITSEGGTPPPIGMPKNCRLLASNYTILD
ncbi:Intracellular hyphae 1 protein [Rutstroemia sp. NJR-2017a WRK4]|nr:Intracellular hyphae 1 protein [Rutstroemia sp. NJR-2017a WRK4]